MEQPGHHGNEAWVNLTPTDFYPLQDQHSSLNSQHTHSMNSVTSEYSHQVQPHCCVYEEEPSESSEEPIDEASSPACRVLGHLNKILVDKVNIELEGFGQALQELLTQQFDQVRHLVSISKSEGSQHSQESKTEKEMADHRTNSGAPQPYRCESCTALESRLHQSECIIQLLTSALAVSEVLYREVTNSQNQNT